MAKQVINLGSSSNDGTGDPLRTAFTKINANFTDLYGSTAEANDLLEDSSPQLGGNLDINGWNITSARSNEAIRIIPNGTGTVELEGATNVTGTFSASAAATLSTSLTLASGATVTGILDEDAMGTNSATQLATQQSIKAYVNSQVTAQDLDFQGDSGGALAIDLDSESLTFTGGTGIDTTGAGNAVTFAIDSTVTTLTGSQVLTNKTLTSPVLNTGVSGTAIKDEDAMGSDSATHLATQQSIKAYVDSKSHTGLTGSTNNTITTVTGANAIQGEANLTFDGTTLTLTGTATLDGVTITDNTISTNASNSVLGISANGSGTIDIQNVMTTIGQTVTGTVSVTGQHNVDNLRLDGNTISATSGGITLTPATNQNIVLNGLTTVTEIHATLAEVTKLRADTIQNDTSDGDITFSTQGTGNINVSSVKITNLSDPTSAQDAVTKAYADSISPGGGGTGDLTFTGSTISSPSNADLTLNTSGSGNIVLNASIEGGTADFTTSGTITGTLVVKSGGLARSHDSKISWNSSGYTIGGSSNDETGYIQFDSVGEHDDALFIKCNRPSDNSGPVTVWLADSLNDGTGTSAFSGTTQHFAYRNDTAVQVVGDDSVTHNIKIGEQLNIVGGTNITTAVSGTTLRINSAAGDTTGDLTFTGSTIQSPSNADLTLEPSGTGAIVMPAITINDNKISTSRSNDDLILGASGTGSVAIAKAAITGGTVTGITDITVADGGTGASSLTDNSVLTGTGTSPITAEGNLTFNGSTLAVTGAATVSTTLGVTGASTLDGVTITDNTISSNASNANLEINANGSGTVNLENLKIGTGGATVTTILDEDAMGTNSATALASQQSIKAYVDAQSHGGGTVGDLSIVGSTISAPSNADLTLITAGSGDIYLNEILIHDGTITTHRSDQDLILTGAGAGHVRIEETRLQLGQDAGRNSQGTEDVALGYKAGENSQGNYATTVGSYAGQTSQGIQTVAVGYYAGNNTQAQYCVAIGAEAGKTTQGDRAVAVGRQAGMTTQGTFSVAVGCEAGEDDQGNDSVAMGRQAGYKQGDDCVHIGAYAGGSVSASPGTGSIAIGRSAGSAAQATQAIAIGRSAQGGTNGAYADAIAVGFEAGFEGQRAKTIAIGYEAGRNTLNEYGIAIGYQAGKAGSAANRSIAIGFRAAMDTFHSETIVLNAHNGTLNTDGSGRFYVKPIREASGSGKPLLRYDSSTGEISYMPHIETNDNQILTSGTNVDLQLNANGTGGVKVMTKFILDSTQSDGSSVAIDLTKSVAILTGNSGTDPNNYTLADGTHIGQLLYLVRGTGSRSSIHVIFSKLLEDGNITTTTNKEMFGQFAAIITCIWRGDCWVISRSGSA